MTNSIPDDNSAGDNSAGDDPADDSTATPSDAKPSTAHVFMAVSYTHLRAHET